MAAYFFDTSAIVKAYHTEIGTGRVEAILSEPSGRWVVSSLTLVEFQSVFAQKVRGGGITPAEYQQLRRKFGGDIRTKRLAVKGLLRRHQRAAEKLIVKHAIAQRLRTLDALQLAVAIELSFSSAVDHFVVADQHLATVAALEGLSVIDPCVP